ncbi:SpoIIAA-like [Sphingomonas guangdongensis]|uniref:SpoIIAA-like n=1 Tax=Sphingomonas guangdongensis TaxID=1141890 RepID=A0A285QXN1_9SPHN|nr:STAS/SEC14 domain-containing protein [Sphingomonas guangdongensis]SOB86720.1 SpoIIAA-like [Sphingomonas guangdongensis]
MYDISIADADRLVVVRLGGLMSVEEVDRYMAELGRTMAAHRLTADYRLIVDVIDCPIQTQAVIDRMREHMAAAPRAAAIAVVTASSLARMQIRRLFQQPYARVVSTLAEARAWVLKGEEPLAA